MNRPTGKTRAIVKWGEQLGGEDGGLGGSLPLDGRLSMGRLFTAGFATMRSVDSDFDSDLPARNLLALNEFNSLLLLLLVTDINETITLAPPGLAPPPSNDTSRNDLDTSRSEDFTESFVIDVEGEIGNKDNTLGGFSGRDFSFGARSAFDFGSTSTFSGFGSSGFGVGGRGCGSDFPIDGNFSFGLFLVARLALLEKEKVRRRILQRNNVRGRKEGAREKDKDAKEKEYEQVSWTFSPWALHPRQQQ